jgi:hypothetical protein
MHACDIIQFIQDESIFTSDVEYQLSIIYPTNLKSSKAQKFKNSKVQKPKSLQAQKLNITKVQKLKSVISQKLTARWPYYKLLGGAFRRRGPRSGDYLNSA